MKNIKLDELISLQQAARLDLESRNVHASTYWRWALRGVRGVRLATRLIGGRRYTSLSRIHEFLDRINQAQIHTTDQGQLRSDDASAEDVDDELRRQGW